MKENAIKALIDARTIEAISKKLTQKMMTIAQYMGSPIIGEYSYSSVLPDFWEYEIDDPFDSDRIREASEGASENNLGFIYDSLKHGVHFEILVRIYADKITLLRASYGGNHVYIEEEGVLKGYAPDPKWEQHMEDLYAHAIKLEKIANKEIELKQNEENKFVKKSFLQKLKLIWGYE